ncbi:hypothetical protein MFLAVUS_007862 [Mucor flavus]|uniref:Sodium/sulfate symporter n=1 Tax=Mucor flavus TaxID=439312 RepID=A0ABP9Z5I7_9FUNG
MDPKNTIYHKFKQSNIYALLPSILLGCLIWFGTTPTDELTVTSIRLLAVFMSCIFALITTSVDISVLVLSALALLSLTKSFQCCRIIISVIMGIAVLPNVVQSIATTLGSTPSHQPKVGGFLMLVGAHANLLSASMFLTGMAPNPIVIAKANALYPELQFNFMTWIQGSCVPALFCAATLPLILSWSCGLYKSKTSDNVGWRTCQSFICIYVQHAAKELREMGTLSIKELQLYSTLVALIGIVALLHMGTVEWSDVANNKNAWETLFWLGGFVTIASQLSEAGASQFLGHKISAAITHLNLPAVPALAIAYFLTTLYAGFVLGANPMTLTCLLAYFGALGGCMTIAYFSTGSLAM